MTTIKQEDFIQSIADAYQFISYYHPVDFIKAMAAAYEHEESPAAKNAIAQILINARMAAEGHRPICQDTGIAVVYLKVGMNVRWDATLSVTDMVSEGVRRAYTNKENPLRGSIVADPDGTRKNTRDNSPAVVHMELVPGDKVEVLRQAEGPQGGRAEELRLELFDKINALGIGAQGLGGLTTLLDVKVLDYPTHAVMKPVAIVPNCAATRHLEFELDGSGPAKFEAPSLDNWPKLSIDMAAGATRVDLAKLDKTEVATWKAGDRLLRKAAGRFHQHADLLRRPGRSGA